MNAPLKIAYPLPADAPAEECEVDYGRACPTIPDVEYQAIFTHHETAYSFSTPKVFLWFRIIEPGPHFDAMIYAAFRVRRLKGNTFNGMCKGTTKAGTLCKRRVVFANGFCKQHGGDSTEFMRERVRQLIAKSRTRIERLKRRLRGYR